MAYSLEKLQKKAIELLEDRGVTLKDIGQIVLELQKKNTFPICLLKNAHTMLKRF